MAATLRLLDKLRTLITHDGTPAGERQAALERLERLIAGHDGMVAPRTRVTRSVKIGRQRRRLPVDEWGRLAAYTAELSHGECLARIARACEAHGLLPLQIDFGEHAAERPVIAIHFPLGEAPNTLDFAAAVRAQMPEASVNLANQHSSDERLFLIYLPGRVTGSMAN